MQPIVCSRCKKNVAVVFITKIENGKSTNDGLCLVCAKELGIRPVDDIISRMGISDDDLESLSTDMLEAFKNSGDIAELTEEDDTDEEGKTATFPFLHKLFGSSGSGGEPGGPLGPSRPAPDRREGSGESRNAGPKRKFLENYCISLTGRAVTGKLDCIIGRESEIQRVTQILSRRQKNNPCLIGEPGVGKTAIAEGLAQRIADGQVPYKLRSKEVYLLDLTALVAGTQFRGQFESRMKGLIEEIRSLGNIILVIDEVHNLVGAGDAEGSMNAANILKPALSRGEIQVIGATTFTEYRKHIEKDAALERRFQPVTVDEPSITETIDILNGIAHYYEQFHGVSIPREVLRQAVLLSERYITDRFLPDKAIDLIDEACADVGMKDPKISEAAALRGELTEIHTEQESLVAETSPEAYARLASLRSRELQASARLDAVTQDGAPQLSVDNLAFVIEQWTKIPASKIRAQEFESLARLEDRLKNHIVGQNEAIASIAAAIRRRRVGVGSARKPISFLFVGPTGVGKTELVRRLALDLFDTPESLIRLDMSEFMEKHAVSRIIGAPPGYVGYDEAGQLTEKIRRKPYSVVLFDEIEKAHPDVLNILLQILDDGMITDSHGRRVNFENTVLVLTSNAGSDKSGGMVGFGRNATEQSREKAVKALRDFLRPEFINRLDEIVAFNALSKDDYAKIAEIMLRELMNGLAEREVSLTLGEGVISWMVEKSFSLQYGARNLKRLIQKELEDGIAALMIERHQTGVFSLCVACDGDHLRIDAV